MFDRFLNTLLYSIFMKKKIYFFLIINYVNELKVLFILFKLSHPVTISRSRMTLKIAPQAI